MKGFGVQDFGPSVPKPLNSIPQLFAKVPGDKPASPKARSVPGAETPMDGISGTK